MAARKQRIGEIDFAGRIDAGSLRSVTFRSTYFHESRLVCNSSGEVMYEEYESIGKEKHVAARERRMLDEYQADRLFDCIKSYFFEKHVWVEAYDGEGICSMAFADANGKKLVLELQGAVVCPSWKRMPCQAGGDGVCVKRTIHYLPYKREAAMKHALTVLAISFALFLTGCIDQGYGPVGSPQYAAPPVYSRVPSRPSFRQGLPANFEEYKQRYAAHARTPQGAVKLYFDAVFCYIGGNREEALKMLRYSMHEIKGWERTAYHSTFMERLKDPRQHHIFRSFASGTSPDNDYAMSPESYSLMIDGVRDMHGYTQVILTSSGADSPRVVQVRQYDDGLWYVIQNAGTYTQVREPYGRRLQRHRYGHDADYD